MVALATFRGLCRIAIEELNGRACYNFGTSYLGITFNSYEDMWAFMKSPIYRVMREFRILSPYHKFLYFERPER